MASWRDPLVLLHANRVRALKGATPFLLLQLLGLASCAPNAADLAEVPPGEDDLKRAAIKVLHAAAVPQTDEPLWLIHADQLVYCKGFLHQLRTHASFSVGAVFVATDERADYLAAILNRERVSDLVEIRGVIAPGVMGQSQLHAASHLNHIVQRPPVPESDEKQITIHSPEDFLIDFEMAREPSPWPERP